MLLFDIHNLAMLAFAWFSADENLILKKHGIYGQ
jgi:hypothetical protein